MDIRVLDLSCQIAGPYCCNYLADSWANVIKVERGKQVFPCGRWGPWPFIKDEQHIEKSGLFLLLNTRKRGITLGPKSETRRNIS